MATSSSCAFTRDGLYVCAGASRFGQSFATARIDLDDLLRAHANLSEPCPPVRFVTMLLNRSEDATSDRRWALYARNVASRPELRSRLHILPAVDGKDSRDALRRWRALGIPFKSLHASSQRSFGALACLLSYAEALALQHEQGLPYLMAIEDDVALGEHMDVAACVGARQMGTRGLPPSRNAYRRCRSHRRAQMPRGRLPRTAAAIRRCADGVRCAGVRRQCADSPVDLVTFGTYYSEMFLTSLHGARRILRRLCAEGITTNKVLTLTPTLP